jgi:hypothetical protein
MGGDAARERGAPPFSLFKWLITVHNHAPAASSLYLSMNLLKQINSKRMEIRTDVYSMSIGEWISLYEKKEVDIHPEFQRFYRWSDHQKTSLIESILLGIPIPPIFVSQREDGVWDVVDGLQRLSTIYQLVGILKDEKGDLMDPLILEATEYLPSLKGIAWDKVDANKELPPEAKLIIKRSKISVSIVLKESDKNAKFDLFKRLNTGGSQLSPQEVRNCLLVMLNADLYKWMRKLANYKPFVECTSLSDHPLEEGYDVELVLRFLVFYDIDISELKQIGDVGVFLTNRMTLIAQNKTYSQQTHEKAFKKTFDVLQAAVGDGAFKRYNFQKDRHEGGFLLSQYEVVAMGIGYNLRNLPPKGTIPELIQNIWDDDEYTEWAGSGITATRRLPRLIPLGREVFGQ